MSDAGRQSRQTRLETFKQGHLSTLEAHRPPLESPPRASARVVLSLRSDGESHQGPASPPHRAPQRSLLRVCEGLR